MDYGVLVINELRRYAFDQVRLGYVRIQFAARVNASIGQDVVLYQSRGSGLQAGYFAVAKLIDADVSAHDPNQLVLRFGEPVYFRNVTPASLHGIVLESYLRSDKGSLIGWRLAEDFRALPEAEFEAIVSGEYFPQSPLAHNFDGVAEAEGRIRERVAHEAWQRSIHARLIALPLYNFRCAITGQRLLSLDGMSSGLEVAHVQPVADGGPDIASNLVVLCPDFHKRYDQGTIDILDDYTWIPIGPNHDAFVERWPGPRRIFVPEDPQSRLDPKFLMAHRQAIAAHSGRRVYGSLDT